MRLHLVGLPSTHTTAAYSACAYTQKVRKLAKMMTARGHDVFIYSGAENDAPCVEHVPIVSAAEQSEWYGPHEPPAYPHIDWNPTAKPWIVSGHRAAAEIAKRAEPHDLVLLTSGSQKGIADALPDRLPPNVLCCEFGVGYIGSFTHAAYESYAWLHHVYGVKAGRREGWQPGFSSGDWDIDAEGQWFDAVIPNYFDLDEFSSPRVSNRKQRDPYLVYVGRVILRKGPHIAAAIARELGMRLVVAGPGVVSHRPGEILGGDNVRVEGDVEYVGCLGIAEREQLMANAACLLAPTTYVEPFGGVAVEAMLCGTPAVTTDWGAFTETVAEGVSGFRFRRLSEGVAAVENAMKLNRAAVRGYAVDGYSLEAVAPLYERWFAQLDTLWRTGWPEPR